MKKKILFINPCLRHDAQRKYPPVGLACILTAVEKAGIEFDLIDMDAHNMSMDNLREQLHQKTYDICALGCIVTGLRLVKEIAVILRENNPQAKIIAGNSVATSIPELLLHNTKVDMAVMGEGDITIVELLHALIKDQPIEAVDGIAFLKDKLLWQTRPRQLISDLDEVGFPNWDLFELARYNDGMVKPSVDESEYSIVYPLNAARGCPFQCSFCYHVFRGQRYRKYSEEMVVAEFKRLHDKYHATVIQFWDELTFPNIPSIERMVTQLEKLPFRVGWEAITRGDMFQTQHIPLIKRMREAGCKSRAFSIENASPEILKAMNKKINVDRLVKHCDTLRAGQVVALTSIIFGYPQETLETIHMTLDLCERCNVFPSAGFLQPLPGTPIYDWTVQNGYIKDELTYLLQAGDRQDFHINLTSIPTDEFIDAVASGLGRSRQKIGIAI